jgi:antitoxin YefM
MGDKEIVSKEIIQGEVTLIKKRLSKLYSKKKCYNHINKLIRRDTMQQTIQLDISSDIFDKVMFFLENLPKDKVKLQIADNISALSKKVGKNFVVLSLEDYQQEQETLYVLNNNSLMGQLENSFLTYQKKEGYKPTINELNLDGDD